MHTIEKNAVTIPVTGNSSKTNIPIKYLYRPPQWGPLNVRIKVGRIEYTLRKLLETKKEA